MITHGTAAVTTTSSKRVAKSSKKRSESTGKESAQPYLTDASAVFQSSKAEGVKPRSSPDSEQMSTHPRRDLENVEDPYGTVSRPPTSVGDSQCHANHKDNDMVEYFGHTATARTQPGCLPRSQNAACAASGQVGSETRASTELDVGETSGVSECTGAVMIMGARSREHSDTSGLPQSVDATRETTLTRLYEGNVFGEIALLYNEPRNANVRAITKVRVTVLSA